MHVSSRAENVEIIVYDDTYRPPFVRSEYIYI